MRRTWVYPLLGAVLLGCPAQELPAQVSNHASVSFQPDGVQSLSAVEQVTVHLSVVGAVPGTVKAEFQGPGGADFVSSTQALTGPTQDFDFDLPVAGTLVQSGGLSGKWNVRLWVNDAEQEPQSFELQP